MCPPRTRRGRRHLRRVTRVPRLLNRGSLELALLVQERVPPSNQMQGGGSRDGAREVPAKRWAKASLPARPGDAASFRSARAFFGFADRSPGRGSTTEIQWELFERGLVALPLDWLSDDQLKSNELDLVRKSGMESTPRNVR
jgi:hypothetical protein